MGSFVVTRIEDRSFLGESDIRKQDYIEAAGFSVTANGDLVLHVCSLVTKGHAPVASYAKGKWERIERSVT